MCSFVLGNSYLVSTTLMFSNSLKMMAMRAKLMSSSTAGFKMPVLSSMRKDSLLVGCLIAAVIYYVPQDLGLIGMYLIGKSAGSKSIDVRKDLDNPQESLDQFLSSRGLDAASVKVTGKSGNRWAVKMANQFD